MTDKNNENYLNGNIGKLNSFSKLFEEFGSNDEFRIHMENRACMHCWIVQSTLYCSTCMCFYCASCAHMNHATAGSYHDIISVQHSTISRTDTAKSLQEKRKNYCKRHKNKELTYCCTSCNYLLICETCIIIDGHGSHLLLTIAEAIPRCKQILLQSLSSLNAAAFYMSQKILEISALAEQRKNLFESNLLNLEDTQKSLTNAINSEEQLLFTELNLLASKLDRGGRDICQSCVDLKEMLVSVCGEVSIILQLAKESPSHALNRYVKISHVVKGTLDPTYKVLVPELQHLSVPYWNLNVEIIEEVLNDTNSYTQEHINHAMKLSDAITKIASGDLSVVEEIGPINVQVYSNRKNANDRSQRAKVHKIFTNKLKVIQNDKLKNIQNPLIAPKSSIKINPKIKAKTKNTQSGPKIQEWLGIRDWKNNQAKKQTAEKLNNLNNINLGFRTNINQDFNHMELFRGLSNESIITHNNDENKDIEILTIGRDRKLETLGRSKHEKLSSEEYYESRIHFTGVLMGTCVYKKKDGEESIKVDEELTQITIKYCFPFIILYDTNKMNNNEEIDLKENSTIIEKTNKKSDDLKIEKNNLPVISPGLETIDIPIILGKIEVPKNALFVADIRQTNIRVQSIHSNSITPQSSKFLGAASTSWKPIEDGFEISNVIRGNTIEAWIFSCPNFYIAEKWISMLKCQDKDIKSCVMKVGSARLCVKSLVNRRTSNIKIGKSTVNAQSTNINDKSTLIDIVPKIPDNTREKLLILAKDDHHDYKQNIRFEDEEGEYYEEQEIDLPDLMSIRLDRKITSKKTKSFENLMVPSILKVGKEPVIQIERLNISGLSKEIKGENIVMLTKSSLSIISQELFDKYLSHDILLDEYSISEKYCLDVIRLNINNKSQKVNFSIISSNKDNSTREEDLQFGFEYKYNHESRLNFYCPTKESEIIWLDAIHRSEHKKPFKYWKQVLDGIIKRHRKHSSRSKTRSLAISSYDESSMNTDRSNFRDNIKDVQENSSSHKNIDSEEVHQSQEGNSLSYQESGDNNNIKKSDIKKSSKFSVRFTDE